MVISVGFVQHTACAKSGKIGSRLDTPSRGWALSSPPSMGPGSVVARANKSVHASVKELEDVARRDMF